MGRPVTLSRRTERVAGQRHPGLRLRQQLARHHPRRQSNRRDDQHRQCDGRSSCGAGPPAAPRAHSRQGPARAIAMITARLSLRRILLLIVGSLTVIITLLAGANVYGDWQRLTNIRALRDGATSSDQLFNAAEKLAVERDVALSMLYTNDFETIEDLKVRLNESRRDADTALRDIATALDHYTFPELASLR